MSTKIINIAHKIILITVVILIILLLPIGIKFIFSLGEHFGIFLRNLYFFVA